jgi:hypothetical protein
VKKIFKPYENRNKKKQKRKILRNSVEGSKKILYILIFKKDST